MASASASLNGAAPELWPGPMRLPGASMSRLLPRLAFSSVTFRVAPLPSVTRMMTAATPRMMPSIVRMERMTLRRSSRKASNKAFRIAEKIAQQSHNRWQKCGRTQFPNEPLLSPA
jgi:hypothetical protein